MSAEIGTIITCVNITKQVAEYFKLIEGLGVKIDSLINSELDTGLYILEQVITSEKEKKSLLREARSRFYKATTLEKNERLVCAYIGLAICHYDLDDKINCYDTLRKIDNIRIEDEELIKTIFKESLLMPISIPMFFIDPDCDQHYKLLCDKFFPRNYFNRCQNLNDIKLSISIFLGMIKDKKL